MVKSWSVPILIENSVALQGPTKKWNAVFIPFLFYFFHTLIQAPQLIFFYSKYTVWGNKLQIVSFSSFAGSRWRDLEETMSDVAIALVVIVIVVIVTIVVAALIRVYGIYHLTSCFASSEEKAGLTQHEQYNGYMVRHYRLLKSSGRWV